MEHTKHLWRAGMIVLALLLVYVVGRHFAVPESFGAEGFYRADSRLEFMAYPVVHGARGACAECHEAQRDTHDGGKHASVSCEVCHAPLSEHVRDGEKFAEMATNTSRRLCELCHLQLRARPETFPQIVPAAHLEELGAMEPGDPIPDRACGLCHPSHDPQQDG